MHIKNRNKLEKGFTLVEISIVLLISGLILYALSTSYLRWNELLKSTKTKEHISIIADAVSAYASRNFRIPCPADPRQVGGAGRGPEPFGNERGSGVNGNLLPIGGGCPALSTAANGAEGIVPFASLGIPADVIRDGWGNYFTYQVTPIFTRDPEDTNILVHARCRTTDWVEGTIFLPGPPPTLDGGRNIAPQKARFCCPSDVLNTRGQIFSSAIGAATPNPSLIYRADPNNWYEATDDVTITAVGPPIEVMIVARIADHYDATDPVANGVTEYFYNPRIYGGTAAISGHTDMPVYVLISHGKNGAQSFIDNSIGRLGGGGLSEIANGRADLNPLSQNVYDLPHNSVQGVTYYDDIVSWQTQTDLLARLRGDTCAAP